MRLTPPYTETILIVCKATGRLVWRFGPGSKYPEGDFMRLGVPADNTALSYVTGPNADYYEVLVDPDLVMDEGL